MAHPAPHITVPADFNIGPVDRKFRDVPKPAPAPLGPLASFTGVFAGTGFNSIFRPNSNPPTTTTFPNPVKPAPPQPPSENVLELNLTKETLSFTTSLGDVPNRGLEAQNDIFLNGVPYVQSVSDVANPATGRADGPPIAIHFEPGIWMHVPETKNNPILPQTLVRMASIPHGTTINAQGLDPLDKSVAGPPTIPPVDMTPFVIGQPTQRIRFPSQTASNADTPRLPQDLTKFIAAGTITQAILDDPNTLLRKANEGKNIIKTVTFSVSTLPIGPPNIGGGADNIAFLVGSNPPGPNADAVQMRATFWVETVQHKIRIPIFKPGQQPMRISPEVNPGEPAPVFLVQPPREIVSPITITVNSTQIQYSQVVFLNFAGLTWPHVSVATLVPSTEQSVPPAAW